MIRLAFTVPIWSRFPYAPDQTYANAYPNAKIIANNFCPLSNNLLSCSVRRSAVIIPVPINNCKIQPADIMGDNPNYINVPLFDAKITLIHIKGSLP